MATSETGANGAVGVGQMNPAALTVQQAARMLALSEQSIRDDIAAGAPTAANGTINLVHYAAWLNSKDAHAD